MRKPTVAQIHEMDLATVTQELKDFWRLHTLFLQARSNNTPPLAQPQNFAHETEEGRDIKEDYEFICYILPILAGYQYHLMIQPIQSSLANFQANLQSTSTSTQQSFKYASLEQYENKIQMQLVEHPEFSTFSYLKQNEIRITKINRLILEDTTRFSTMIKKEKIKKGLEIEIRELKEKTKSLDRNRINIFSHALQIIDEHTANTGHFFNAIPLTLSAAIEAHLSIPLSSEILSQFVLHNFSTQSSQVAGGGAAAPTENQYTWQPQQIVFALMIIYKTYDSTTPDKATKPIKLTELLSLITEIQKKIEIQNQRYYNILHDTASTDPTNVYDRYRMETMNEVLSLTDNATGFFGGFQRGRIKDQIKALLDSATAQKKWNFELDQNHSNIAFAGQSHPSSSFFFPPSPSFQPQETSSFHASTPRGLRSPPPLPLQQEDEARHIALQFNRYSFI